MEVTLQRLSSVELRSVIYNNPNSELAVEAWTEIRNRNKLLREMNDYFDGIDEKNPIDEFVSALSKVYPPKRK
jgi:hypothetical protein